MTPAERLDAYAETGSYMAQKYFGSPARKMKADQANQIFGLDAEGKPSYGVPLSNYMNAQVCLIQVSGEKVYEYHVRNGSSASVVATTSLLSVVNSRFIGVETKRATTNE